jgi:hypothetical protein
LEGKRMDDRELYQHFVTLNEKIDLIVESLTESDNEEEEDEEESKDNDSKKRFKKKDDNE